MREFLELDTCIIDIDTTQITPRSNISDYITRQSKKVTESEKVSMYEPVLPCLPALPRCSQAIYMTRRGRI